MPFSYIKNFEERITRQRAFWSRQMPSQILVAIWEVADLARIDPNVHCPDVPSMFSAWEHNFGLRQEIDDDYIPVARVSFGSAAFGAFLGAEITFKGGAGWAYPFLESYNQLDSLKYNHKNEWIQRQLEACQYFAEKAVGKFPVCETEPNDALNFAEALRGSRAYTDIYDFPQELKQLLDFASDFNIRLIERQREVLSPVIYHQDGIFSMFWSYLPGKAPWISVDAYGNCSPDTFNEFGAPYIQRMINHFEGGWIHIHSHALHNIQQITNLTDVVGIGIWDDPNAPRGFESLTSVRNITKDIPLQIDCTAQDLEEGMVLGTLPGNVMYLVKEGVKSIEHANRLAEQARLYRSPVDIERS
jgi:hypothetical protein